MSKNKNAAHTSEADKLLDAVEEIRNEEKAPSFTCVKCGGHACDIRRPLGEPAIFICRACKYRAYKGVSNPNPFYPVHVQHGQGEGRGPAASTLAKEIKEQPDKLSPTYRRKGKTKDDE